MRKHILDKHGHFRYFGANYNPNIKKLRKKIRPKMPVIDLSLHPEITTEKKLIKAIYDKWGIGEYRLIGYVKGRRGCWVFWKGNITEHGFIFFQNEVKDNIAGAWDKEINESNDEEERRLYEDFKKDEISEAQKNNRAKRYGFLPFLKPSGRRGQVVLWSDLEPELMARPEIEQWERKEEVIEDKKWSSELKKAEFAKW